MLTTASYLSREVRNVGKDKVHRKPSLRRWVPTIIILCLSVWSAPAEILAQQAAPASLDMTEQSTLWSLEGPGSNKTPYLLLGMADREDTPSYDLLWTAGNKATTPSAENTITRQVGLVASANRTEKVRFDPLVLSSLLDSNAGPAVLTNVRAKPIAQGSFRYGYQSNYLSPEQRLVNDESYTHKVVHAPRPFFELEFGGWRLPVMLSGAQFQDNSQNLW
jgi:hypothetical protein